MAMAYFFIQETIRSKTVKAAHLIYKRSYQRRHLNRTVISRVRRSSCSFCGADFDSEGVITSVDRDGRHHHLEELFDYDNDDVMDDDIDDDDDEEMQQTLRDCGLTNSMVDTNCIVGCNPMMNHRSMSQPYTLDAAQLHHRQQHDDDDDDDTNNDHHLTVMSRLSD